MNYIEIKFQLEPHEEYIYDLLAEYLANFGFESFDMHEDGMLAYIPEKLFDEPIFAKFITDFEYADKLDFQVHKVEQVNWNEEWEKHFFEPIVIGDECLIHSSFHTNLPDTKYKILVDPKMSFGTGHHETTSLMIGEILTMNFEDKTVLDMGCGTAVLAILAAKRGAKNILAIDIDDWCVENSLENIHKNNTPDIEVLLGDAELLKGRKFNIILANINRNILLHDMATYAACLDVGDELYLSGFYQEDISILEEEAGKYQLQLVKSKEKHRWSLMHLVKTQ